MENIYTIIIGIIGAIGGTGFFTYIFTKKKYDVEVLQTKENAETTAIDNDIKLSNHYKEILDDLKARYETRYKEFEEAMKRKIDLLEEEIKLRDRKIKLLQNENLELKKELRIIKQNGSNSVAQPKH